MIQRARFVLAAFVAIGSRFFVPCADLPELEASYFCLPNSTGYCTLSDETKTVVNLFG